MIETVTSSLWEDLIHSQRWEELRARLTATHSSDIAEAMGQIHAKEQAVVFRLLSRDHAAQVFSYLPADRQKELLRALSTDEVKSVLDGMPPDDRTRFFEELPATVTRQLLEVLSPEELKNARQLLGYPEHSVGRYMTPDYVAIRPEMTASQALEHIRKVGRGMETLNVIYILDENGKLLEDVRLGSLVLADPQTVVTAIADPPLVSLLATDDRERALELFEKYDRVALPVTDALGNMLGIVTADDMLDIAESEATEDIQKLGGSRRLAIGALSRRDAHGYRDEFL